METSGFLGILITGIAVIAISYVLDTIWAAALPVRAVYLVVRLPGVALHECAHILGCLLTGARIGNVVLFSDSGGSVTYARPKLPVIGDVIISTAPLFLLPLALVGISWIFGTYLGCIFPAFPSTLASISAFLDLVKAITGTFSANLVTRFNAWFLLYLYLTVSLVLSAAPSKQDMKNAATGTVLLVLAGVLVLWTGIPVAVSALDGLVRLIGYGFVLGLVFGLVALFVSLPLLFWYLLRHR